MFSKALFILGGILAASVIGHAQTQSVKGDLLDFIKRVVGQFHNPAIEFKQFTADASYALCFVPDGPSCERLLIDCITNSQHSLLIQAYSFTSVPIASAVVAAYKRGVDVRLILDKSQVSEKYTSATFLKNTGIPVVVDTQPAIAHNKIMIFDHRAVFTGSFNFSKSAQKHNAENGIVIRGDAAVVKAYIDNWTTRYDKSSPY